MWAFNGVITVCYAILAVLVTPHTVTCLADQQSPARQVLKSNSITQAVIGTPEHAQQNRHRREILQGQDMTFIVDDHNAKRRMEPASDMEYMKWNSDLAAMALEWARGCWWGHGQPTWNNPPFKQIGQNLYATTGPLDLGVAMRAWADDEKVFYHYDTGACDKEPCGHYTQVVWSTSREVGCAQHFCENLVNAFRRANYLVCNYGPAGNYQGVKPFRLGPACSQCASNQFWCDNGLCRSDCGSNSNCYCGAKCLNQGCMTSDCKCNCQDGFTGPNCAEVCEDKHKHCGANPGWPKSWCQHSENTYVPEYCPLMCGICRPNSGRIGTCPSVSFSTAGPVPTPKPTKPYEPPVGTNKGVIIETSTQFQYWDRLWDSLLPLVASGLTDYCNDHSTECCGGQQPKGEDSFLFNKDNVFVGLGYPRFGRFSGEESTQILVYASSRTGKGQCQGATPQDVVFRALQSIYKQLDGEVQQCCDAVLLTLRLGEEPRPPRYTTPTPAGVTPTNMPHGGSSFPAWAIAFLVILVIGGAVVFTIGALYWRRRVKSSTRDTDSGPSSPPPSSVLTISSPLPLTSAKPNKPQPPAKPPKASKPQKPEKPQKQVKPQKPATAPKPILKNNSQEYSFEKNARDDIASNFNGLVQERIQGYDNSAYYNS